ncbi:HNH endonuclease signature motif containing protein [Cellulomonas uda]|uniref:HNH nuclease domain-containing protein n=1 Tax=Cellulomonas uda TaxID=1714 RepID=A0A4Y3KGQ3_CELUD|nr:HNH endonuclease signature motif containing protein [Cellulomonas uda]NII68052.1 hypothetical protein [Cellulomonas uda]GEA82178.1 hypothetical protein CUD01_26220 [Cellulomonas uda]
MFDSSEASWSGGAADRAVARAALPASGESPDGALDALEAVRVRLATLAAVAARADGWSGTQRARALGMLDRIASLVTVVRSPVLAAQQSAAAAVGAGREFADTRARLTGSTRWHVAGQVRSAEALTRLPTVRAAMAEGVVRDGHVDVLARTLEQAPARAAESLRTPQGQAAVVELARGVDAREFGRTLTAWVAAQDDDHLETRRAAQHRARFLTLTHAADGTHLRGRLDPVTGRLLQRALDATGHRPDDDRTPEQARADALAALAGNPAAGRVAPPSASQPIEPAAHARQVVRDEVRAEVRDEVRAGPWADVGDEARGDGERPQSAAGPHPGSLAVPHVSLLVPAETWVEHRRRAARRQRALVAPSSGSAPATPSPSAVPLPPAVTDDGTVLSPSELATALCDCAMTRVVMDAAGRPLDVGRTRRSFTPAQRLAVVARDRACVWNGCSVPPAYCEVHHIAWWNRDGGTSDLVNAVLLCSFHHHEVHRLDLTVERHSPALLRTHGGPQRPPTGAEPGESDATPVPDSAPGRPPGAVPETEGVPEPWWVAGTPRPDLAMSGGRSSAGTRYTFRNRSGRPYNVPASPTRIVGQAPGAGHGVGPHLGPGVEARPTGWTA